MTDSLKELDEGLFYTFKPNENLLILFFRFPKLEELQKLGIKFFNDGMFNRLREDQRDKFYIFTRSFFHKMDKFHVLAPSSTGRKITESRLDDLLQLKLLDFGNNEEKPLDLDNLAYLKGTTLLTSFFDISAMDWSKDQIDQERFLNYLQNRFPNDQCELIEQVSDDHSFLVDCEWHASPYTHANGEFFIKVDISLSECALILLENEFNWDGQWYRESWDHMVYSPFDLKDFYLTSETSFMDALDNLQ